MRVYSSSDAGAPQLVNVDAGNYLFGAILKAVLVDGYGSQPGAGWTCPFSNATGLYVFRQGTGNQRYFRVDDSQTAMDTGNNRVIYVRGYEAMTDINTGTNPFPTVAQVNASGPALRYRSTTHYTGYLPTWEIYADATTCLIFLDTAGGPTSPWAERATGYFGQFDSIMPGDTYGDCVWMSTGNAPSTSVYGFTMNYSTWGAFVTRSHTGAVGSIQAAGGVSNTFPNSLTYCGEGNLPFPDPVTGGLILGKLAVLTSPSLTAADSAVRGYYKWLWDQPHAGKANFMPDTIIPL